MGESELKVRLPREEVEFLEDYAREHAMSMDAVVARSVRLLRRAASGDIHPDVLELMGLVPSDVDVRSAYADRPLFPQTSEDDVFGCLAYDGPMRSANEMKQAVDEVVRAVIARSARSE